MTKLPLANLILDNFRLIVHDVVRPTIEYRIKDGQRNCTACSSFFTRTSTGSMNPSSLLSHILKVLSDVSSSMVWFAFAKGLFSKPRRFA